MAKIISGIVALGHSLNQEDKFQMPLWQEVQVPSFNVVVLVFHSAPRLGMPSADTSIQLFRVAASFVVG